jgi:putative ABC transport system permease protein
VFGRAALLTGIGLVVGIASALGLTRFMRTLLYDVPPNDPLTLASVTLVLGVVALAACYVPSRRAVGVDAVVALRTE